MQPLNLTTVIGYAIVLLLALVRWRRERDVRSAKSMGPSIDTLQGQVAELTAKIATLEREARDSAQKRQMLEAENLKLRKRCARYARQIKQLRTEHAQQIARLQGELDKLSARLGDAPKPAAVGGAGHRHGG